MYKVFIINYQTQTMLIRSIKEDDEIFDSLKHTEQFSNTETIIQVEKSRQCDTIHIALVCGGFNSTRSFYVLLKSILFYRTDPIHLHLMVNDISYTILRLLLESWSVPELRFTFYNATNYERQVSWVTSRHYSRLYGLLKLVFLTKLSEDLDEVILVDTDMLVIGNVRNLWVTLKGMISHHGEAIFGMVENQSEWYLKSSSENRIVWPALGRGFNSGLILVNLFALKQNDWDRVWRQETEIQLISHLTTSLADQDVFNSVIWRNHHLVYKLDPSFNIQLNDHSTINENDLVNEKFKVIHWNSPHKLETSNPFSQYFINWYQIFTDWDGKLLKRAPCSLSFTQSNNQAAKSSEILVCKDVQPNIGANYRTYLYFFEFDYNPSPIDVTLTVHLSLDRLLVLDQLAGNWNGPISVSIYLSEVETSLLISSMKSSFNLVGRTNIGYHLVFRDQGFTYPINKMRNTALENALTQYVLLSDIDFLPSMNLYEYLKATILGLSVEDKQTKSSESSYLPMKALVIPAFETLQYRFEFPNNKAELLTQLNLGSISTFREQIWPKGHSATDYSRWRVATKAYTIDWEPDYEPFIVVNKDAVRFDERFIGFGWNKVESIMELAAQGYQFIVLPEAFLIHKIHSASYDIMNHRMSARYRLCLSHLKRAFQDELRLKYPEFFTNQTRLNTLIYQ